MIGLRTFIQEVLKRSKTSYSTLQVALYYLVLIKPHVPKIDFTQIQSEDSHVSRAMQCGRRMFLAALILASKYLQDRNYSARAWSKISGLKIAEINSNEIAFVSAIDWKLHVPESRFQRWTDVVLRFSQSPPPLSPSCSGRRATSKWRAIIPRLTPELDDIEAASVSTPPSSPRCHEFKPPHSMSPPSHTLIQSAVVYERTTAAACTKPQALEPVLRAPREQYPLPPISPKISQLPTPQPTPGRNVSRAPAASCKRSSMSLAMKQIQRMSILRCSVDPWPSNESNISLPTNQTSTFGKSSCFPRSTSSVASSPESMISDTSSISSFSSVASAGAPLSSLRPVAMATHRCTTMNPLHEDNPWELSDSSPVVKQWPTLSSFAGAATESYVRGEGKCCGPSSEVPNGAMVNTVSVPLASHFSAGVGCKRERPRSISGSTIQHELRYLLADADTVQYHGDGSSVLRDHQEAASFLLASRECRSEKRSVSHLPNLCQHQQLASRKRICCDTDLHNKFTARSTSHQLDAHEVVHERS